MCLDASRSEVNCRLQITKTYHNEMNIMTVLAHTPPSRLFIMAYDKYSSDSVQACEDGLDFGEFGYIPCDSEPD